VFAESCVFSKQSPPPFLCNPPSLRAFALHDKGHTFSRSYGVNLPSSLTSVLSRALGYSPRPPESVCGTDNQEAPRAAFLGSMGSLSSRAEAQPHHLSALTSRLSLSGPMKSAYWLEPESKYPAQHTLLRPCSIQRHPDRCRNINLLAIIYPFRARLRFRLTHGRIILPQETLGLRRQDFSSCLSLLMPA
jgi:hypothetical protein